MIERMREIASYEGIKIDETALAAIAYRADGGLRDALTMLEQAAAFADGTITTATIELAFGASGRGYANLLLDAVLARDASTVLRIIEEASDAGTDMQVLIRSLIAGFRNLLVARVNPELLARDLAPEDAERATERAQTIAQASIVRALRVLTDAASLARTGGNARLELETSLLRFVLASEDPTLEAISARLAALEEGGAPVIASALAIEKPKRKAEETPKAEEPPPQPKPRARPKHEEPAPPAAAKATTQPAAAKATPPPADEKARETETRGPVTVQKVRAAWNNIRGKVESERASLRVPLSRTLVDSVEGNAVLLKLPDSFSADILRDHIKLVESAIADTLGTPMKVTLKVDGSAKSAPKAAEPAALEDDSGEDIDALFNYANERIRER
jgi:DNA polymerase-3 subunit gamma/tau